MSHPISRKVYIISRLETLTDNGEETFVLEAEGECAVGESGLMLQYPESDNEGVTRVVVTEELTDLQRTGQVNSRMTFVEGKLLPAPYHTPHGELDLSLYTHELRHRVDTAGCHLKVRYTILSAGRQVADNTLVLEARFVPEP